jgi:aldose 1-epimerase
VTDSNCWPGGLVRLSSGITEALVAPGIGANCVRFRIGRTDVLEQPVSPADLQSRPAWAGCPVLFPLPGRLPDARYTFRGREYRLPANAPDGQAFMHGFTSRRRWQMTSADQTSCTLGFNQTLMKRAEVAGYPWCFELTLRWSIRPGVLRADVQVTNPGAESMPFGFGLHPYFRVLLGDPVRVPARSAWPHEGGVPSGAPIAATGELLVSEIEEGTSLLLTGLAPETLEACVGSARLRFNGRDFPEVVVYRPTGRAAVAVEPWTSVSSAAAGVEPGTAHGPRLLEPGATWSTWAEISCASRSMS